MHALMEDVHERQVVEPPEQLACVLARQRSAQQVLCHSEGPGRRFEGAPVRSRWHVADEAVEQGDEDLPDGCHVASGSGARGHNRRRQNESERITSREAASALCCCRPGLLDSTVGALLLLEQRRWHCAAVDPAPAAGHLDARGDDDDPMNRRMAGQLDPTPCPAEGGASRASS